MWIICCLSVSVILNESFWVFTWITILITIRSISTCNYSLWWLIDGASAELENDLWIRIWLYVHKAVRHINLICACAEMQSVLPTTHKELSCHLSVSKCRVGGLYWKIIDEFSQKSNLFLPNWKSIFFIIGLRMSYFYYKIKEMADISRF